MITIILIGCLVIGFDLIVFGQPQKTSTSDEKQVLPAECILIISYQAAADSETVVFVQN